MKKRKILTKSTPITDLDDIVYDEDDTLELRRERRERKQRLTFT